METNVGQTDGKGRVKRASSKELLRRETDREITVGLKTIDGIEGIALGFRVGMIELTNPETGEEVGYVMTGSGVGSDWIMLKWREHEAAFRGADLLAAFVSQVDPKSASHIPNTTERLRKEHGVRRVVRFGRLLRGEEV